MKKLTNWLQWIDDNIVKILVVGFIFLIPLYPKFPLFNLEYTYVKVRLEDFYIALMVLVFAIQFLRNKVNRTLPFFKLFVIFWVAVFLSFIWGFYIQHTVKSSGVG